MAFERPPFKSGGRDANCRSEMKITVPWALATAALGGVVGFAVGSAGFDLAWVGLAAGLTGGLSFYLSRPVLNYVLERRPGH